MAQTKKAKSGTKIVDTFCHQCHMKCPISCKVVDGRLVGIRKATCVKGQHAVEDIYHPKRLIHPMRRLGDRGSGNWGRATWQEALDLMAQRYSAIRDKFGPNGICTITGCFHKENSAIATLLFGYLLKTPNVLDANHLCSTNDSAAQMLTYGDIITNDRNVDYPNSKCILIWGANPPDTRPAQAKEIYRALRKGAKLIVVDPRPTEIAKRADIWLKIRPGTDAALALGMINVIIDRGLYDACFVDQWCMGFEELKERTSRYKPDLVSGITWLSAEDIRKAAELFATIKPSCLHTRLGPGAQQVNATQTARATAILLAICGQIDQRGSNLLSNDLGGFKTIFQMRNALRLPAELEEGRLGASQFPLQCGSSKTAKTRFHAHTPSGIKAMLRGEIKGMFIAGNNLLCEEANSRQSRDALKNLEFLAVSELSMTPTAEMADMVLPAAHWLETESVTCSFTPPYNAVMATQKAVEPPGECKDDRETVIELAKKMGLESPWCSSQEIDDFRLENMGLKFEDLAAMPHRTITFPLIYQKYKNGGFKTPSGKVELYSSTLKEHGYDPLPDFLEPPQSPISTPQIYASYPIILTNYRHIAFENSEYHQIGSLRAIAPYPPIEISSSTAAEYGIINGDEIWVETPNFSQRIFGVAKVLEDLPPGVLCVPHGWWYPEKEGPEHGCFDSNINAIALNGPPYDPINGNYQLRAILCRIGKVSTTGMRSTPAGQPAPKDLKGPISERLNF